MLSGIVLNCCLEELLSLFIATSRRLVFAGCRNSIESFREGICQAAWLPRFVTSGGLGT